MKKPTTVLVAVVTAVASAFACAACAPKKTETTIEKNDGAPSDTEQTQPTQTVTPKLEYGKKYYWEDTFKWDKNDAVIDRTPRISEWIMFNDDGTGKRYWYNRYQIVSGSVEKYEYTINFKYTYTNVLKNKVACFYDSVTYGENDNKKQAPEMWSTVYEIGENILLSLDEDGYRTYINETYLDQIPNFGSSSDY